MVHRTAFGPIFLVAAVIGHAACSSSPAISSPPDGSTADAPSDGHITISSTAVIGPSGGTVSAGGASVEIPAAALSAPTSITVSVATDAPPLPGNVTLAGDIFAFTPHGQPFASLVAIRVPFTQPATGTPVLYAASADDELWAPVTGAISSNGVLSAQAMHFSWFAPVVVSTSMCAQPSESCRGVACCPDPNGFEVGCDGGNYTCKVMLGGSCQRDTDCMGDPQFFGCVGFRCCGKSGATVCTTSDASECCSGTCIGVMTCQ
jgi:hypothetical protein